jgi:hypothetical protein
MLEWVADHSIEFAILLALLAIEGRLRLISGLLAHQRDAKDTE